MLQLAVLSFQEECKQALTGLPVCPPLLAYNFAVIYMKLLLNIMPFKTTPLSNILFPYNQREMRMREHMRWEGHKRHSI
jgi:hypothetical protein